MRAFSIIFILFLISQNSSLAQENSEVEKAAIQSFKLAPSYFIPNHLSQKTGKRLVDDVEVAAFVQTQKGRVMFTPSGAYIGMAVPVDGFKNHEPDALALKKQLEHELPGVKTKTVVLKAGFSSVQARKRGVVPRLEEITGGTVNFMVGQKESWRTKVPTYRKLVYDQVWDGVDLEYLGYMDHLEFRWLLQPGSDPNQIAMETGAQKLQILKDGSLQVSLAGAKLVLSPPFAYQVLDGETVEVPVEYTVLSGGEIGFKLGTYLQDEALVIDPILSWSTYLGGPGGKGFQNGWSICLDNTNSAYITGQTPAGDFPATTGAYDDTWNGGQSDVFVSKLNPEGDSLIYSTFLGSSGEEKGSGIKVDSNGNAYITGSTNSSDFPTTSGAYDESYNGSSFNGIVNGDLFVTKLTSDGSGLIYSSYLGGSSDEEARGIAVDSSGNAYVTGSTRSNDFPSTSGSFDETYDGGSYDVFVSKLNSNGSGLVYSTFLGGTSYDSGYGIAVDSFGNAYVIGATQSSDYPTTSGAFNQTYNGGNRDVFVSKLSIDGSGLIYSTFLGGEKEEKGYAIDVNVSGNAYVTGYTQSSNYPTTIGAYDEVYNGGNSDVFVSKLNTEGNGLIYSTFLGGTGNDLGYGIAVDSFGNAYVTGKTSSDDYPATIGAYDDTFSLGFEDMFISKLTLNGNDLDYSTFIGSIGTDIGFGIAVDNIGNAYTTGYTTSNDFPTTNGAYDETHNASYNVFVSKLNRNGSSLIYSTFLGGTDMEKGYGIVVDSNYNAFVTGYTFSSNFPTTSGSYDEIQQGFRDVFVSKLSNDGRGLIYSTFLGGHYDDFGYGISLDRSGNAYVTGYTWSSDFPTTAGAFDEVQNGYSDVFVSKLNSEGSGLIYSTFLGGTDRDESAGIALDSDGNAYVTGKTSSVDYPTINGSFDESYNGGYYDVFVSKLNSAGSGLIYSTLVGGEFWDESFGIDVDNIGHAYIAGLTYSSDFPTTSGSYDETLDGGQDAFVSKLSSDGRTLIFSTFIGGSYWDEAHGIAVDNSGNAIITGNSESSDYPTSNGSYDETSNGGPDVFVSKLNSDATDLIYSTFLGGSGQDYGYGISLDRSGNAYVTGYTWSSDFPTTAGAFDEVQNGYSDVFVSKLNSEGSGLIYSTYLGGSGDDWGYGIAIDTSGNAYVTGNTYSSNYPSTSGSFEETQNGYGDAFVTKLRFYFDFNLDGCSNALDFSDLLPYWNQLVDPDHKVNVLDFLQIDLDGPNPCP